MTAKFVLPGDRVGVAEEYIPGTGTYEEEGILYANMAGELELDEAERVARVHGFNPPLALEVGDTVLATVERLRSSMVIAAVQAVEGREREVSGETEGTIHISKISEEYTEDVNEEMRIGDLVRAKVIQVEPSLQLATNEPQLGVVYGFCTVCRRPLEKKGNDLYCENDERTESRKVASVYNALLSTKED